MSQTPLTDKKNLKPWPCILPASTWRMTGLPRLAPTLPSRFHVLGQMDVVPFAFLQAFCHDRGEKPFHRAVVQDIGRLFLFQLQVYLDAVALIGPDEVAGVIEGESFLVVRLDAFDQFIVA